MSDQIRVNVIVTGLPSDIASAMCQQAETLGCSLQEYVGVMAIAGVYGHLHPLVQDFFSKKKWPKVGRF